MKLKVQAGETKVSYAGDNWRKAGWQRKCVRISKARHKDERVVVNKSIDMIVVKCYSKDKQIHI